jgi:hypothetical protein
VCGEASALSGLLVMNKDALRSCARFASQLVTRRSRTGSIRFVDIATVTPNLSENPFTIAELDDYEVLPEFLLPDSIGIVMGTTAT